MSKDIFAVKVEGKLKYLRANRSKINLPGFGKLTAEEFAKNAEAIQLVMEKESLQHILREVPEAEYKQVLKDLEESEEKAAEQAKAEALQAEKVAYEAAKAIVIAYEAKYGNAAEQEAKPKTTRGKK